MMTRETTRVLLDQPGGGGGVAAAVVAPVVVKGEALIRMGHVTMMTRETTRPTTPVWYLERREHGVEHEAAPAHDRLRAARGRPRAAVVAPAPCVVGRRREALRSGAGGARRVGSFRTTPPPPPLARAPPPFDIADRKDAAARGAVAARSIAPFDARLVRSVTTGHDLELHLHPLALVAADHEPELRLVEGWSRGQR